MTSPVLPARSDSIQGMETYREKATRKFKQNPWVPLGSLATVGALVTAMVKMRRGDSHSLNRWLRVRVAAQGLTILALVGGTYSLGAKRTDEHPGRVEAEAEARRVEKVDRERKEFEGRLRGAEVEYELETGKPAVGAASAFPQKSEPVTMKDNIEVKVPSSKGSWLGWLWTSEKSPKDESNKKS